MYIFAVDKHMVLIIVDRQVTDRILAGLSDRIVVQRCARVADRRADAREQLGSPEGLFNVIVRSQIERSDLVTLMCARGNHDDR